MQPSYFINQPNLFSKKFIISGQQGFVAAIKFRGFADTKATAEFNNREWILKSNFLNDKVSIESTIPETIAYTFNGSVISSKGSIEIDGNEYTFKALFLTRKRSFVWLDNAENELIKFTISGPLKIKGQIEVSNNDLGSDKLNILFVLGFYLIKANYYSMGSRTH